MYGTQTFAITEQTNSMFENDVKMYGTQTYFSKNHLPDEFENDVKMYGTQTEAREAKVLQ